MGNLLVQEGKFVLELCVYIYMGWVQVTPGVTLSNVTPLNIF